MARRAPAFPKSYSNRPLRKALETFAALPNRTTLDALLAAMRTGGLVVDITGSTDATDPQLRTILSTAGELVLPLFTSVSELRLAVPVELRPTAQAMILPAKEALALVSTADFVAVQFDVASLAQVVKREYVLG
ncbi:SseB family protein [Herbiconiux ginsengi]|uniref:SseB protein N-terminal domain-containing protein n=1 Tax=Herbiconiux ginsengi TaxID=381665 RepID=A0A1H3M4F4_9MICO|nr:SseB family protein [Herbiconiux ginsengi]SDY71118.1 SseB protein N-terminal domain-containing protein [Herbiconiux ginsengi]